MLTFLKRLKRPSQEPVAVAGITRGLALILSGFGLELTGEQVAAVMVVLELLISYVTRERVKPIVAKR